MGDTTCNHQEIAVSVSTTGQVGFTNCGFFNRQFTLMAFDQWHHIAGTYDGSTFCTFMVSETTEVIVKLRKLLAIFEVSQPLLLILNC